MPGSIDLPTSPKSNCEKSNKYGIIAFMEVTAYDLRRVYLDTIAANQIGGETDGVTEEGAYELGYDTYEGVRAEIQRFEANRALRDVNRVLDLRHVVDVAGEAA
jgi:hypothetical protein